MTGPDDLVSVAGLSGGYGGERLALSDVSFAVRAGESLAVLGPNGGGKTTLFRALLGDLPVRHGDVVVGGRPAYVPQGERTRLDFPVSALDVALMGAYGRTALLRRVSRPDRRLAAVALERVGMAEEAGARFGTLSGGQRQRVLIARALVQDAQVLLLDEPLSGVDSVSAQRIGLLFDELQAEGHALLVATHDVAHGRRSDRVLCLNGRQVAFGAPDEVLTMEALEQTYGGDIVRFDGGGLMTVEHHHGHESG